LEVREIKLIIHQTKRRTGRVNLSKHCRPPSERTCPPFNGEVRAQLDWVIICVSTMAGGLGSPVVRHHFSEAVCLGWQVYCSGGKRQIRGRELLGLIAPLLLGGPQTNPIGIKLHVTIEAKWGNT
jgi:predicted alpha/beta-hydrolase family hydrolase